MILDSTQPGTAIYLVPQSWAFRFNVARIQSRLIGTPLMEYVSRGPARKESWYAPNFEIKNGAIPVPTGPGMGLEFDPDFLKKATVVSLA